MRINRKKIVNKKRFFEIREYKKNNIRMKVKTMEVKVENFHKKVEKKENR